MELAKTLAEAPAVDAKALSGRMVLLGFLAQNTAIGLTFGVYGAFVKPFSDSFGVSRAVAASGLAIIALTFGLSSPWVGGLVSRRKIANVMTAGAMCMVAGFALLAVAPSATSILLLCGLLGLGASLLGPLPAMTLMTNWFDEGRGRAIGIVMIPLGVMIMPVVTTIMIEAIDWRATFACFAVALFVSMPLLRLVRNAPAQHAAGADQVIGHGGAALGHGDRGLLGNLHFWVIAIASGLIIGAATAIVTHLLPYASDLGIDPKQASLLLAIYGGMGMAGSFLFGWLSDRFGGAAALMANAFAQMVFWLFLWRGGTFWPLFVISALIGMCGGGVASAMSMLLSVRFGPQRFGQTLGLVGLVKLPFTFGAPLFMGYLFDATGGYGSAFLVHVGLFALAGVVFAQYVRARTAPGGLEGVGA